jgi:hypothetical protein
MTHHCINGDDSARVLVLVATTIDIMDGRRTSKGCSCEIEFDRATKRTTYKIFLYGLVWAIPYVARVRRGRKFTVSLEQKHSQRADKLLRCSFANKAVDRISAWRNFAK